MNRVIVHDGGMATTTTPSINQEVASEIRAWLGRRRLTGRQLATRMGASQTWTATRLRGEQEITINDLQRFASALEVKVGDLLPPSLRTTTDTFRYSPTAKRMSSRVPSQRRPAGRVDSNRPARPTGPTRPTTLPRPALPVMAR